VSSANGLTLNDNFTSAGTTSFDADSNDDGTGNFTVASGKTVTTGNGSLSVAAGDIILDGSLNSGAGSSTIVSSTNGNIGLGAGIGSLSLDDSELGRIAANNLVIGDSAAGGSIGGGVTAAPHRHQKIIRKTGTISAVCPRPWTCPSFSFVVALSVSGTFRSAAPDHARSGFDA